MIIPANDIIARAEKFVRLRRDAVLQEENIDRKFMLAVVCDKMAKRICARGHQIAEWWAAGL